MNPAYCPTCDLLPATFDDDGLCVTCGGTVADVSKFLRKIAEGSPETPSFRGAFAQLYFAYYEGWPREYGMGAKAISDALVVLDWPTNRQKPGPPVSA